MDSMEFLIEGDVNVKVTVTEHEGNLVFNFHVIQPGEEGYTGQIGELNGVFFDFAESFDGTITSAVTDEGEDLYFETGDESISNLGGGVNMNGEVIKEDGKYDIGILTDETGLGNGDTQDITFTLDADADLTLADVLNMDFGVRLTSVGDPDGTRDGSLKLGGEAVPEEPPTDGDDTMSGGDDGATDPDPTNNAIDDLIFADEDAMFDGMAEFFQEGGPTLLSNDLTENADGSTEAYTGEVTEAGGEPVEAEPIIVPGSNGGLLKIYPDGTVDFSANGEFDLLADGDTSDTTFTYGIEGGDTATVTVRVFGLDDFGDEFADGEDLVLG